MKCPACKKGRLKIKSHKRVSNIYTRFINDKGVLQCDSCGYKEVFD